MANAIVLAGVTIDPSDPKRTLQVVAQFEPHEGLHLLLALTQLVEQVRMKVIKNELAADKRIELAPASLAGALRGV